MRIKKGPCRITDANGPKFHPESWNTNANIFFIDQPVGVGFSYAEFGETVVHLTLPCIFFENKCFCRRLQRTLQPISQHLWQFSSRILVSSKAVLSTWLVNHMAWVPPSLTIPYIFTCLCTGPIHTLVCLRCLRPKCVAGRGWLDANQLNIGNDRLVLRYIIVYRK